MKRILSAAAIVGLFVLSNSCVDLTVEEPTLCATVNLGSESIPFGIATGTPIPPVSFTQEFDFSQDLSKISDVTDQISIDSDQITINNSSDLNWISHLDISIAKQDHSQEKTFAHYVSIGNSSSKSIEIPIIMPASELINYVTSPFELTFTVQGTVPKVESNLNNTFCIGVSGQVNKSL